jgi:hypothetical protein
MILRSSRSGAPFVVCELLTLVKELSAQVEALTMRVRTRGEERREMSNGLLILQCQLYSGS